MEGGRSVCVTRGNASSVGTDIGGTVRVKIGDESFVVLSPLGFGFPLGDVLVGISFGKVFFFKGVFTGLLGGCDLLRAEVRVGKP